MTFQTFVRLTINGNYLVFWPPGEDLPVRCESTWRAGFEWCRRVEASGWKLPKNKNGGRHGYTRYTVTW